MVFDVFQYFINGMSIGGHYALIAIGYSLVFGVLKFVNFAHGDLYMLGAYLVMTLGLAHFPIWIALPVGAIFCGLSSAFIYQVIYKPLQNENRLTLLISAVAISFLLENGVQLFFSPEVKAFPFSLTDEIIIIMDRIVIRVMDLWMIAITLLLCLITHLFVHKTKIGQAIRAIASNPSAALVVGIPVNQINLITFFIGAVLATIAGTLQSMATNQIYPFMGVSSGLKAFAAAVLGGIGSIWGSIIGGFALGLCESILVGIGLSTWKDSFAFIFLILVLLIRPQGFFGKKQWVKL